MGRKIFTKIGLKHALTQGSIISGCISADYPDKEVYGLIITPRCDLSHGIKVSTVHYLPIVKIDDWKDCDGKRIFIEDAKKQIKSTINNWVVNEYNVYNFLDLPLYSIQKLRDMLNEKKANEKIKKAVELFIDFNESNANDYLKNNPKLFNKILERLVKNELAPFYIIESWENTIDYFVVNLREIHQISKETARKLQQGFFADNVAEQFFLSNSLKNADPTSPWSVVYEIVAQLDSPYIEHLLQRYTYNFSRIGVEDFQSDQFETAHYRKKI